MPRDVCAERRGHTPSTSVRGRSFDAAAHKEAPEADAQTPGKPSVSALRERGEKLDTPQTGMAAMAAEAETLYETTRQIRERAEHNSKWLPF